MSLPLAERLKSQIQTNGPITFRDWMESALYDPADGYYTRVRQRWGRGGDYRTSPERSVLFAATFACYFASLYKELGEPSSWSIVECGGGDGRFANGLLGSLREHFESIFLHTNYVFVEVDESPRDCLEQFRERVVYRSLNDLQTISTGVFFSNELLDAFPVHRVTKHQGELLELYVTTDAESAFTNTLGPISTSEVVTFCEELPHQLEEGQTIDVNTGITRWLATVASKLQKGFVITVDYGAEANELYSFESRPNGSLRAYSRHNFVDDVLANTGICDITSSVDWSYVKRVGKRLGLEARLLERQDKFLLQEGILEALELRLAESRTEAERASLTTAAREMIMPDGMAASFQVLVQEKIFDF